MRNEQAAIRQSTILVVGDIMLDRYWQGTADRVSPEAPVPVVAITASDERPGGAANVALNIAAMGVRCILVGAVGGDDSAQQLRAKLSAAGVVCAFVDVDNWSTTIKMRIVSNQQQLLRMDFEQPMPKGVHARLLRQLQKYLPEVDGVVLEDYDKGVLDHPEAFIEAARKQTPLVVVDPKLKPLHAYRGAMLVKPNATEFQQAAGVWKNHAELLAKARSALENSEIEALLITTGALGMTLVEGSGQARHIPARPVDVHDVTGAGDTVTAALAVALVSGASFVDGAIMANAAAGVAVTKSGTATVSVPELERAMRQHTARGVMTLSQLVAALSEARNRDERIVFTNGCFDILHAGHVACLEEARSLGDRLIVALNDDASVTRSKGEGRPINTLEQRARVVAALGVVDWVVPFSEDSPRELLQVIRPDVLVKGGDYKLNEVVGSEFVKGYGGEVKVLSLVQNCSTSDILSELQKFS